MKIPSITVTPNDSLTACFLTYFDKHVADILAQQNPDGSFGEIERLNDQFAFAPLAMLYTTPSSHHYKAKEILSAAMRGMDRLAEKIDEQGRIEFIGHDGFSHGRVLHDWSTFYWQQAIHHLQGHADEQWLNRHTGQLIRVIDLHSVDIRNTWQAKGERFDFDVHNLFVWKALLLYRGGMLWDRQDWRELGEQILLAAVAAQQPDGWWPEGGPTMVYNYVTTLAISLFYEWSGRAEALAAVGRSLIYHDTFTYPDGRFVETVDGRVRYSDTVSLYIPPSFSRFQQGQAYLASLLQYLPASLDHLQGISMMSCTLPLLRDEPIEPAIDAMKPGLKCRHLANLDTAVLRDRSFYVCASGYAPLPHISSFRLDRQNLLSIWHSSSGLIVGGGHSKLQPAFSVFNVTDRQGQVHYLHRDANTAVNDNTLRLNLTYGQIPVWITTEIVGEGHVRVRFGCDVLDEPLLRQWNITARLLLFPRLGQKIEGTNTQQILDDRVIYWTAEDHAGQISHNGWTISLPDQPQTTVEWPIRPYNSYRPDRKDTLKSAGLAVSVPLTPQATAAQFDLKIT